MTSRRNHYLVVGALLTLGIIVGCPGDIDAPIIDPTLITISPPDGGGIVTVTGQPGAISDESHPITYTLTNLATVGSFTGTVNLDGSFTAALPGTVGDPLFVAAVDGLGNEAEVGIGSVPPESGPTPSVAVYPRNAIAGEDVWFLMHGEDFPSSDVEVFFNEIPAERIIHLSNRVIIANTVVPDSPAIDVMLVSDSGSWVAEEATHVYTMYPSVETAILFMKADISAVSQILRADVWRNMAEGASSLNQITNNAEAKNAVSQEMLRLANYFPAHNRVTDSIHSFTEDQLELLGATPETISEAMEFMRDHQVGMISDVDSSRSLPLFFAEHWTGGPDLDCIRGKLPRDLDLRLESTKAIFYGDEELGFQEYESVLSGEIEWRLTSMDSEGLCYFDVLSADFDGTSFFIASEEIGPFVMTLSPDHPSNGSIDLLTGRFETTLFISVSSPFFDRHNIDSITIESGCSGTVAPVSNLRSRLAAIGSGGAAAPGGSQSRCVECYCRFDGQGIVPATVPTIGGLNCCFLGGWLFGAKKPFAPAPNVQVTIDNSNPAGGGAVPQLPTTATRVDIGHTFTEPPKTKVDDWNVNGPGDWGFTGTSDSTGGTTSYSGTAFHGGDTPSSCNYMEYVVYLKTSAKGCQSRISAHSAWAHFE